MSLPDLQKTRTAIVGFPHSQLGGLDQGDDHPQYLNKFAGGTISGPLTVGCPLIVQQDVAACDPVFQIFGHDTGTTPILRYRRTPSPELFVEGSVLPGFDFINSLPLYELGNSTQYWRRMQAWELRARQRRWEPGTITISGGGTQNNYNLFASGEFSIMRANLTADTTLTGISRPTAAVNSPDLDIINISSFTLTLNDQDGASSASNRIITGTGAPLPIDPEDTARIWYDDISDRWRVMK